MELKDTIKMMNSPNYKERFKAEYWQTKIRYTKLHNMIAKHEAGTLEFTPSCNIDLLKKQKRYMGKYLNCLEIRADVEGIDLVEPLRNCSNCKFAHRLDERTLRCDAEEYDTETLSCFELKE